MIEIYNGTESYYCDESDIKLIYLNENEKFGVELYEHKRNDFHEVELRNIEDMEKLIDNAEIEITEDAKKYFDSKKQKPQQIPEFLKSWLER